MELSVLMPAQDAARYVGSAVRSTLRAMPARGELLVYDDGSRDGTAEAIREVADARIRVLRGTSPVGVAQGLQLLLAEARGEHVARMDADDICLPWRFRYQRAALSRYGGILFGTVFYISGRGLPIRPTLPTPMSPAAAKVRLLLENPFKHPTMYTSRETMERLAGYREVAAEDYDCWLRAAGADIGLRRLPRPVLLYRMHRAQVSRSVTARGWLHEDRLLHAWEALARQVCGESWFQDMCAGSTHPAVARPPVLRQALQAPAQHLRLHERLEIARRLP